MPQDLVSTPLFTKLDGRALEVSMILLELALEPRQKRKRISSCSCKTSHNLIVVKTPDLFCARFYDRFAKSHLPVSGECDVNVLPHEQHRSAAHPIVFSLHAFNETIGTRLNVSQGHGL